jgi:hypothetical protein
VTATSPSATTFFASRGRGGPTLGRAAPRFVHGRSLAATRPAEDARHPEVVGIETIERVHVDRLRGFRQGFFLRDDFVFQMFRHAVISVVRGRGC